MTKIYVIIRLCHGCEEMYVLGAFKTKPDAEAEVKRLRALKSEPDHFTIDWWEVELK